MELFCQMYSLGKTEVDAYATNDSLLQETFFGYGNETMYAIQYYQADLVSKNARTMVRLVCRLQVSII
jgi:hypothetical protein